MMAHGKQLSQELQDLKTKILNDGMFWGEHNFPTGYYWDLREVFLQGKWLRLISKLLWEKIQPYNPEVIYGNGIGSVPLLGAIQLIAHENGVEIDTLIIRDSQKDRNRQKHIEGVLPKENKRAIFIDDIMGYGNTFNFCQETLKENNVNVTTVACCVIVDRWTSTGSRRVRSQGIPVEFILTRHDLGSSRIDPWVWEGLFKSKLSGKRLFTKPVVAGQLWRNLEHNLNYNGIKSPMVFDDDRLYWSTDYGKLICTNINSGQEIWSFQQKKFIAGKIINYPYVDNNAVYFNGYDGISRKLNKMTGEIIWSTRVAQHVHSASVIDSEKNSVYVCTEYTEDKGSVVCLDKTTGHPKWKYYHDCWIPATPNFKEDVVITGTNNNKLIALNANTGELIWSFNLTDKFRGQVTFIEDRVCSFDESGMFRMNNYRTGELLFERCFGRGYHSYLKYDLVNDQIIFGNWATNSFLFALNSKGEEKWMCQLRGQQMWSPTIYGNKIFSVSQRGYLSTINSKDGEKLSCDFLNYLVGSPVAFNGTHVAINSLSNGLFMYKV
jgi:outer membrane protein assembly factor BamB/orotate phosphoribosyltransferase